MADREERIKAFFEEVTKPISDNEKSELFLFVNAAGNKRMSETLRRIMFKIDLYEWAEKEDFLQIKKEGD